MHRHHMHHDYYVNPCAAFALGVMVGVIGSAKIVFFHKMHRHLHRNIGHCFGSDSQRYGRCEGTESDTANGDEFK